MGEDGEDVGVVEGEVWWEWREDVQAWWAGRCSCGGSQAVGEGRAVYVHEAVVEAGRKGEANAEWDVGKH